MTDKKTLFLRSLNYSFANRKWVSWYRP